MQCWLFFHHELTDSHPEAPEVFRFQQVAAEMGIDLKVLKPQEFDLVVDSQRGWTATYQDKNLDKPDLIITRTGSETTYFMLAVLRYFERQGVAMANRSTAVEAVADKLQTLQILSNAGIPVPRTILGKFPVDVGLVERELGFPVIVKTLKGTRGEGVFLCNDRNQFNDLANLLDGASPGADFIFQQFISRSRGRDVRVLVINNRAVVAMERRAADGGFKSNLSLGGQALPFALTPEVSELAVNVASALDLDVAGIDLLFDDGSYKVCEANSSPGFQGLEQCCNINVPAEIFRAMAKKYGLQFTPPAPETFWRRHVRRFRSLLGDAA